jgi:hypothetical protein
MGFGREYADPILYKVIKREMDSQRGVVSQVIIAGKASGLGRQGENTSPNALNQYTVNVGLKVRPPLGTDPAQDAFPGASC